MSDTVSIDGAELLPIKVVAKRFSYTSDYLARLARDNKIVATQVGRKWLIDPTSLAEFVTCAEMEDAKRREKLSLERKQERDLKLRLHALREKRVMASVRMPQQALVFSLAVVMFAVVGGVAGSLWLTDLPTSLQAADTRTALMRERIPTTHAVLPLPAAEPTNPTAPSIFTETDPQVVIEQLVPTDSLGVLLLSTGGDVRTTEDVASLFSDPVTISRSADGLSIVTLREGEDERGLPLVLVPLSSTVTPVESE